MPLDSRLTAEMLQENHAGHWSSASWPR